MLNYTPQNQPDLLGFKMDFEGKLDPNNGWVKMAKLLDWDAFEVIYSKSLSLTTGAKGIDARIVIGVLIIRHIEGKGGRGKQGRKVEFRAQVNVSLQAGYARVDQLDFEAFNEGIYLKEQVENYKTLNDHYPELVQTDEIYMNRGNPLYKMNGTDGV